MDFWKCHTWGLLILEVHQWQHYAGRSCRARPRRGLQCQELAAVPKPESYPQMNSPRRTVQQALPSFLNSCHMLDGKQPTSRNSVSDRRGGALQIADETCTCLHFYVIYIQRAVVVAFPCSQQLRLVQRRGEMWRHRVQIRLLFGAWSVNCYLDEVQGNHGLPRVEPLISVSLLLIFLYWMF